MTTLALRDRLQRRIVPRVVVALSTVDAHHRWAARLRRAAGGKGVVRLYVAFDDPQSAIALLGLADRVRGRRVRLLVEPVVARGIPGDPAVEDKRRYAVGDAARLARRDGRELTRTEPVGASDCAFLAAWAAAIPQGPERTAFCVAAAEQLWLRSSAPVEESDFAALRPGSRRATPRRSELTFRLRRLYDTPVAVVHGQWFFAHERLDQIEHRLDILGWTAAA
jgi:2-hydroxychromene-2-carboxylate isomerase